MLSPTKRSRRSQHLTTSYHNRSYSSITSSSDAGTFHSALAHPSHMEMRPMSQKNHKTTRTVKRPTSPLIPIPAPSPKLEAVKMNRQDSGFSTGSNNSPRNSTSSRRPSPSKREKEGREEKEGSKRRSTSYTSSRPSTTKKTSKSSSTPAAPRTSTSSNRRPNLQSRHTTQCTTQQTYQYFHFPSLSDPEPSDPNNQIQLSSPSAREDKHIPAPPATIQYWTSDNTRRLEYAAIDAASRGVRGFFTKLVPDCILPQSSRRTRFSDGDDGDDVGSVRRYRLQLPDEKTTHSRPSTGEGLWRRFSWGRSRSR
ncbi:hypothetical protein HYALB_00008930 [Hymenoscyphus albidus]|uniref:Uncharacterized protein n=1 Tax=Hymenoscyphus albidus TaxID=595503 RepID=A0A9N9Q637_9HELO|nr:hypothetical protein HYALB_00008930 [Hymenoscyphus albidus]